MPDFDQYDGKANTVFAEGVTCVGETPQALRVKFEDDEEDWIPKSQIHDDSEVYERGHVGTLVITTWIARQKGWWD